MTKFKNLGTVARALSKIDRTKPVTTTENQDTTRWKKLKVPVKAVVLLRLSNKKEVNNSGKISKGKTVRPNPTFKKEAWKSADKSKSSVSKSNNDPKSAPKIKDKKLLNRNVSSDSNKQKSPRRGILKSEPAGASRKKSVTINPRERKSNIYGRSPRSKTKLTNKTKDDLQDSPANPQEADRPGEREDGGSEISEKKKTAILHWRKIRLMLHYLKFPTPGIINLTDQNNPKEKFSFSANLKAMQMVKKFKKISHKQKFSVPRNGGKRKDGSYDYLDRYKQHKAEKRGDPLQESFIHTANVEWDHYKGATRQRDKRGISSHIYIPWNKLVIEPPEFDLSNKRFSCYFDLCTCDVKSGRSVAGFIFARVSRKVYKILTNVIIVAIAFFSGLLFGCMTFFHIWGLTPLRKVWSASVSCSNDKVVQENDLVN